jgi:hypothetical protein
VQRLAMQRRIFSFDDRLVVIRRGTAPYETHGTLLALIANRLSVGQDSGADLPSPAVLDVAVQAEATASPRSATPRGEPQPAQVDGDEKPKRRGRPRKAAPIAQPPPGIESTPVVGAVDFVVPEMSDQLAAARSSSADVSVTGRRRSGQRPPPRWMTAGKTRRGRLK